MQRGVAACFFYRAMHPVGDAKTTLNIYILFIFYPLIILIRTFKLQMQLLYFALKSSKNFSCGVKKPNLRLNLFFEALLLQVENG
jgi:hypothetical protein